MFLKYLFHCPQIITSQQKAAAEIVDAEGESRGETEQVTSELTGSESLLTLH